MVEIFGDAITLKILNEEQLKELDEITGNREKNRLNNTVIVHELITDLCKNSTIENGITLSKEALNMMDKVKEFNYKYIYKSARKKPSERYFNLVINEIYDTLKGAYAGKETEEALRKLERFYPRTIDGFIDWIKKYWDLTLRPDINLKNKVLYHMDDEKDYCRAILDYILGMTDNYAIETYNEIISF